MGDENKSRDRSIDAARGISISLVVLWHIFDTNLPFNGPLVFLRMPLFFFMAGIFARSSFKKEFSEFFKDKIGQLIWIYVVWSAILYLSRPGLKQLLSTGTIDVDPVYSIFWAPPPTMWFIYALALAYALTYLTNKLPKFLVIIVFSAIYLWSVSFDEWDNPPFEIKIFRLMPVFIIAIYYGKIIVDFTKRYSQLWPAAAAIFAPSAYCIYNFGYSSNGLLTALVSSLGIFATLAACRRYETSFIMEKLSILGERSMYVFLMHRIVLSYFTEVLQIFNLNIGLYVQFVIFFFAVVIPATIGKKLVDNYLPWLVKAPWIRARLRTNPIAGVA